MLIKFFKNRGKGSPKASIDYLLGKDRNRELATTLRGSPELSLELSESLSFTNKYTVGCLSFEEPDLPKESKIALIDEFEKMVFAGLEDDKFNICWVEHKDKGRLELNFFIPNVELETKKRYQPYFHRNDKMLFDSWMQVQNDKYGLSDPHDPAKRQLNKIEFKADLQRNEIKEKIFEGITSGINQQLITSRDDVVELLEQSGFSIERTTEKSISISHSSLKKNIRLTGVVYENRKFDSEFAESFEQEAKKYQSNTRDRVRKAQATLDNSLRRRAATNQKKYAKTKQISCTTDNYHSNVQSVNSPDFCDLPLLPERKDFSNSGVTRSETTSNQEIRKERTISNNHFRGNESHATDHTQRSRKSFSRKEWFVCFRDLQAIGKKHAEHIRQRIERLLRAAREKFSNITERELRIQSSKQRITDSERAVMQTKQRIEQTERAVTSTKQRIRESVSQIDKTVRVSKPKKIERGLTR